jgi:hypothetical protein
LKRAWLANIKRTQEHDNNLALCLLEHGADPRIPEHNGNTVLFYIHPTMIRHILSNPLRVDIDARGVFGRTALHMAVLNNSPEQVSSLLDAGIDFNIHDDDGLTAESRSICMPGACPALSKAFLDHHVKLALGMAWHSRLGADSDMRDIPPELTAMIHGFTK